MRLSLARMLKPVLKSADLEKLFANARSRAAAHDRRPQIIIFRALPIFRQQQQQLYFVSSTIPKYARLSISNLEPM